VDALLRSCGVRILGIAGLAAVLAAGGIGSAHAQGGLTLTVHIRAQFFAGDVCQEFVRFDATIVNDTGGAVAVQSVDYGAYNVSHGSDGGLHAGTVLQAGTNTFPDQLDGGRYFSPPCSDNTPDPLVLTVQTDHGKLVWDQSATPLPAQGSLGMLGVSALAGGALIASLSVRRRRTTWRSAGR
jgi:hypothetical protein